MRHELTDFESDAIKSFLPNKQRGTVSGLITNPSTPIAERPSLAKRPAWREDFHIRRR
jgi:hypothetical protein